VAGFALFYAYWLFADQERSPIFSLLVGAIFLIMALSKPADDERFLPFPHRPTQQTIKLAIWSASAIGIAFAAVALNQQLTVAAVARRDTADMRLATVQRYREATEITAKVEACKRLDFPPPVKAPDKEKSNFSETAKRACEALARGERDKAAGMVQSLANDIETRRLAQTSAEATSLSPELAPYLSGIFRPRPQASDRYDTNLDRMIREDKE
jgi:hypothetical protein